MFRCVMMLAVAVCLLAAAVVDVDEALACSGGLGNPLTIVRQVDNAEIIVRGTLEAIIDDAGNNGILHVTSYLKGGPGPEYILVSLLDRVRMSQRRERYAGECTYGTNHRLVPSEEIVIFLTRIENGSRRLAFRPPSAYNVNFYRATTDSVAVPFEREPIQGYPRVPIVILSFEIFVSELQKIIDTPPTLPYESTPYPLLAPLLITTDSGRNYVYPVDGSALAELDIEAFASLRRDHSACWVPGCVGSSRNGLDHGALNADGTITFSLLSNTNYQPFSFSQAGLGILLSPSSQQFATWNITSDGMEIRLFTPSSNDQLRLTYTQPLDYPGYVTRPMGAWHPDGQTMAFLDSDGVWLWNTLQPESEPAFLTNRGTWIAGFSPQGRYLGIGGWRDSEDTGRTIDLRTGGVYPLGNVSLDERLLAVTGDAPYILDLTTGETVETIGPARQITWLDADTYLAVACSDAADGDTCRVVERTVGRPDCALAFVGDDYTYQPQTGMLAIRKDAQTVSFRVGSPYGPYDVDFGPQLDGTIVAIEWLPPLFFYEP